jgi:hypothetical protein
MWWRLDDCNWRLIGEEREEIFLLSKFSRLALGHTQINFQWVGIEDSFYRSKAAKT